MPTIFDSTYCELTISRLNSFNLSLEFSNKDLSVLELYSRFKTFSPEKKVVQQGYNRNQF